MENERIARLEVLVESMDDKLLHMESKVNAMHDILQQIKGAKWLGMIIAAFVGFMVSKADIFLTYITTGRP